MILHEVHMTNFMAAGSVQYRLGDQGLVFVQGINYDKPSQDSNGAGKSTIFVESIAWVLFDKTLRGSSKDRILSDTNPTNTSVYVRISVRKKQIEITRFRAHKEWGNSVRLIVDGQDVTQARARDTQAEIDKLLDVNETIFFRTVILGQGLTHRFSDLGDADRKAMLEKIIDSTIFEEARQRAVSHTTSLRTHLATLVASAETNEGHLVRMRTDLEILAENARTFESKKATQIQQAQELLCTLQDERDTLAMEAAEKSLAELSVVSKDYENKLAALSQKIRGLDETCVRCHRYWQAERKKIDAVPESQCPTCTRPISGAEREAIVKDWQIASDRLEKDHTSARHDHDQAQLEKTNWA